MATPRTLRMQASVKRSDSVGDALLTVKGIKDGGAEHRDLRGRLADLGFSAGERVAIVGVAPLGEPLLIAIRDTTIALRLSEADLILIETD